MKSIWKKILALGLCLTLVLGCAGLALADEPETREAEEGAADAAQTEAPETAASDNESVYVLTDAAGNVEKLIVSDHVTDAEGSETATQTQAQKELPVDVRISSRLDGRAIAPEALADLPAPDAVFIGGSEGRLPGIVDAALAKNPRARLCVSAIALETLSAALAVFGAHRLGAEVTQLAVSRAKPGARLHLLLANNPVFLISAQREETP